MYDFYKFSKTKIRLKFIIFKFNSFKNFTYEENNKDLKKLDYEVYLREVDKIINKIYEDIDALELEITDNISLSDGVINITFAGDKKYVLNVQRPNMQLWLSSPFSGPQRYEFNPIDKQWKNIRTNQNLLDILSNEINNILILQKSKDEKIDLKY